MKIRSFATTLLGFSVSILLLALFLTAAGCGGYNSGGGGGGTAPYITTQPTNQTVNVGQTATFSVNASGTAPLSYQWRKSGSNITGATSASYTTPATMTSDNGSTFDVVVSNSVGSATSNTATLTVNSGSGSSLGWTWIQDNPMIFCSPGPRTSCTISTGNMAPTTAGSVWIIQVQTSNNVTISSVTGGGGAWTPCPSSSCHATNASGFNADAWYNLSGAAGTYQGITVTLSASSGSVFGMNFVELLPPPSTTASFDTAGTATAASCLTNCYGPTLTLSATDAVWMNPGGASSSNWNACGGGYTLDSNGGCFLLNAPPGTTRPTKSFSNPPPNVEFMAIAFKSTAGTFTPPTPQHSVVNFVAVNPPSCSTCTITVPSTGAGHLLFLEAASEFGADISSVSGGGTWVVPSGANTCKMSGAIAGVSNAHASCAYVLSSTPGATTITVTMTGSTSTAFAVWEIATTSGQFNFDGQASTYNTTTGSYYPLGQAIAITGQNDVVFQLAWIQGGALGPTYYPMPNVPANGSVGPFNYFLLNQVSSVALLDTGSTAPTPTWVNPQHDNNFVTAVAFKTQ